MSYFLLYGVFALWVLFDALTRKMGASGFLWALGTAIVGPIILPVYLAWRPLKQGEVREGGRGWNILKNFAILWTIVMAIASIAALMAMAKSTTGLTSDAARAGAGIGMVLGIGLLGAAWFFPTMGAALLGFLLKKHTIVETGPTGPLVGQDSVATAAGGWAGLAAAAFLGLIAVAVASISTGLHTTGSIASEPISRSSLAPTADETEWHLIESKDDMDNTPRVLLMKSGTNGTSLVIRCVKHKTEAFVNAGTVVDNGSVRIKFDQALPVHQSWERSTDYKELFAPNAVTFARELVKAKTFMIEFTPFEEGPRSVSFDVSNLETKLQRISEACDWAGADESRARAKAASAALRARLSQYVHLCTEQTIGKWCWSDPDDILPPPHNTEHGFAETREAALDEAVEYATNGVAFKKK